MRTTFRTLSIALAFSLPLVLAMALGTLAAGVPQGDVLVITNVTLIDGVADAPLTAASVVVRGDRIAAVHTDGRYVIPAGAQVIDGTGRFLIPGLWDTHAHLSYWGEDALEMLVEAGVTSIRELGGDPEEIGRWKAEIAAGRRLGPTMIWCGPFLEGPDGGDEYRFKIATVEEARYAARALQTLGVDFLKIQPAIDRELVAALVDESRDLGLTVVGHLPRGMSAVEGAALGLRSIEHLGPYLDLDDAQIKETIEAFLEHGTWMSPALYSLVAPVEARGDDPTLDRRLQRSYEIVRRFHEAGVPILVGSNFAYRDWPQTPGTGLHGEMRVLVEAGLDPMDVVKLSTSRAAAFAGAGDETGAIRPGLRADMVLLDADPLADIRNTGRIAAVVLRGRLLELR
jgi:imidazolonepropionase-like amidohydrolase